MEGIRQRQCFLQGLPLDVVDRIRGFCSDMIAPTPTAELIKHATRGHADLYDKMLSQGWTSEWVCLNPPLLTTNAGFWKYLDQSFDVFHHPLMGVVILRHRKLGHCYAIDSRTGEMLFATDSAGQDIRKEWTDYYPAT